MTKIVKSNHFADVLGFQKHYDRLFNPTISSRVSLDLYSKKMADFGQNFFVVNTDGEKFGHGCIYCNDENSKTAFISSIGVDKKHKSYAKGIADMLLDSMLEEARINGMNCVRLEVFEDNCSAIAFYERNGFRLVKKTNNNFIVLKRML